ncbi:MAG TPA: hypothetical protein VKR26_06095 [Terriglobales bacterium]|nr:hypothetical protein [Terriglobales bacterium]
MHQIDAAKVQLSTVKKQDCKQAPQPILAGQKKSGDEETGDCLQNLRRAKGGDQARDVGPMAAREGFRIGSSNAHRVTG